MDVAVRPTVDLTRLQRVMSVLQQSMSALIKGCSQIMKRGSGLGELASHFPINLIPEATKHRRAVCSAACGHHDNPSSLRRCLIRRRIVIVLLLLPALRNRHLLLSPCTPAPLAQARSVRAQVSVITALRLPPSPGEVPLSESPHVDRLFNRAIAEWIQRRASVADEEFRDCASDQESEACSYDD